MHFYYYISLIENDKIIFDNKKIDDLYKKTINNRTTLDGYKYKILMKDRTYIYNEKYIKCRYINYMSWETIDKLSIIKIDFTKYNTIIGISTGGAFIGNYYSEKYKIPIVIVSVERYYDIDSSERDKVLYDIKEMENLKEPILIVDDVCRYGNTFKNIIDILKENNYKIYKTFSIFDSPFYKTDINFNEYYIKNMEKRNDVYLNVFCFPWGF